MSFRLEKALNAIEAQQQATILRATENIRAYNNSVGIGDHGDLVAALEEQVRVIADARDIISAIEFLRLQDVTA